MLYTTKHYGFSFALVILKSAKGKLVPNLLPQSIFSFHLAWAPHAGRLLWGLFLLTIALVWTMLLMKRPAIKYKNRFAGPVIIFLGVGGGTTLVVTGKYVFDDTFSALGQVTMGWMTIYMSLIFGSWATIMAIHAKQITLPLSKSKLIMSAFIVMAIFYVIGAKVDMLTIPFVWLNIFIFIALITLIILSTPKREKDGTWAETIIGAFAVFGMMTLLYAVIPHEWINYATSYLNFTKDVKISAGGEFVLKTWLGGEFWSDKTRLIPFEVNMVQLQDQATILIYVIGAVINVKLFVAWQNRNTPYVTKTDELEQDQEAPTKTSRFGRPVRKVKKTKTTNVAS